MPFHRIVNGMAFRHCVREILSEMPGKARPDVSKEFILKRMEKTGLQKVCRKAAQDRGLNAEKFSQEVAAKVREELFRRKGYKD